MDLSLPISYNSLSINTTVRSAGGRPASGYQVDEVDTSEVEIAAYFEKRAISDGIDASDVYLGRRRIGMIVSVFGSSQGDFWDKAQDLLKAFSPTLSLSADTANLGFLPLDFYQPTADIVTWPTSTYPNGIPLRYYVRPLLLPSYKIDRDDTGGVSDRGLAKKFRISLVAKDPRKVLQAQTTVALTAFAAGSYDGDYPTPVSISFVSGSSTGNGSLTIDSNVLSVNIDAASTTYTFSETGEFYKNGALAANLLYDNSTPWVFRPNGSVSLTKTGVFSLAAGARPSGSLAYRQAFA